jgi:hypothetical protein
VGGSYRVEGIISINGRVIMRWTIESYDEKSNRLWGERETQWKKECQWHRWFAWKPVMLGESSRCANKKIWLEWCERRLTDHFTDRGLFLRWLVSSDTMWAGRNYYYRSI